MRTQATRHCSAITHLQRPAFSTLLQRDRGRAFGARAAPARRARRIACGETYSNRAPRCVAAVLAGDDEGRADIAREPREAHREHARELWRAVHHHEREGAGAEEEIGAPCRASTRCRTDHPERRAVATDVRPIAGRERARGVDVRDPASARRDGGDERAQHRLSLIHISEPTRRTPISYAVFCLKKKKKT